MNSFTASRLRSLFPNRLNWLWFCVLGLAATVTQVHAGGGPIAHDIDFEIVDFSATGTRRMPLGFNLQTVDTRIDFVLSAETVGTGNTIIREDGDGDLLLELGENTFVESSFVFKLDISFTDIDPAFNFAGSLAGPALGETITFHQVEFMMGDDPFVPQCPVGFGAFGGCGILADTDDYDLGPLNAALPLGFDVNGDTIDDEITTVKIAGSNELNQPGLEITFGDNPDTVIDGDVVTQDYIVTIDWLININPDVEIALTGLATVQTTADPATVVPLPAAAWLLGPVLVGVFAVARRRPALHH